MRFVGGGTQCTDCNRWCCAAGPTGRSRLVRRSRHNLAHFLYFPHVRCVLWAHCDQVDEHLCGYVCVCVCVCVTVCVWLCVAVCLQVYGELAVRLVAAGDVPAAEQALIGYGSTPLCPRSSHQLTPHVVCVRALQRRQGCRDLPGCGWV